MPILGRKPKYTKAGFEYIPIKKTTFEKQGSQWKPTNVENRLGTSKQAMWTLGEGEEKPYFGSSARKYKQDRFGHGNPHDTLESISPDKKTKVQWYVDWAQGNKNYSDARDKYFARHKKYEAKKSQAGQPNKSWDWIQGGK